MFEEQENQSVAQSDAGFSQPGGSGAGDGANGAETSTQQPTGFQRVTVEEANSLPLDELKRRMRAEASLIEEGRLPASEQSGGSGDAAEDESDADSNEDGTGQGGESAARGSNQQAGGSGRTNGDTVSSRVAEIEAENRRLRQEAMQREQAQREHQFRERHAQVEREIAALPDQREQAIARRHYMNTLNQQALNEYTQTLQTREQAIMQAEIRHARREVPVLLEELAGSVAERHGVKPDKLVSYIKSQQFNQLLDASMTEEALTAAAANAAQWMDYLASEEATRIATEREQRRQRAAGNKKVQRDTPAGGVPLAGGDLDEATRIMTMPRDEFFKMKRELARQAQQQG